MSTIPSSIQLIQSIVIKVEDTPELLNTSFRPFFEQTTQTKDWFEFQELAQKNPSYALFVTYFQLIVLTVLTMHQGILMPSIARIKNETSGISIHWKNGIKDTMEWGIVSKDWINFCNYVQKNVIKSAQQTTLFAFILQCFKPIQHYTDALLNCSTHLENTLKMKRLSDVSLFSVSFYLILSSLPHNLLNNLFLDISSAIPSQSEAYLLSIKKTLETPSLNEKHLMEKLNQFYNLFIEKNNPFLKELVQQLSSQSIELALKNPNHFSVISKHLLTLSNLQILPRLQLYTLFLTHFQKQIELVHNNH